LKQLIFIKEEMMKVTIKEPSDGMLLPLLAMVSAGSQKSRAIGFNRSYRGTATRAEANRGKKKAVRRRMAKKSRKLNRRK